MHLLSTWQRRAATPYLLHEPQGVARVAERQSLLAQSLKPVLEEHLQRRSVGMAARNDRGEHEGALSALQLHEVQREERVRDIAHRGGDLDDAWERPTQSRRQEHPRAVEEDVADCASLERGWVVRLKQVSFAPHSLLQQSFNRVGALHQVADG